MFQSLRLSDFQWHLAGAHSPNVSKLQFLDICCIKIYPVCDEGMYSCSLQAYLDWKRLCLRCNGRFMMKPREGAFREKSHGGAKLSKIALVRLCLVHS